MKDQMKFSFRRAAAIIGIVLTLSIVLAAWLQSKFMFSDNVALFPSLVICYAAYRYCLKASAAKSLAVFCAAVALMSITSNLAVCSQAYLHSAFDLDLKPWFTDLLQIGFSLILALLLAKPYLDYGSMIINQTEQPRIWYTTLLFSAVVFAVNMLLNTLGLKVSRDSTATLNLLISFVLILVLWLLMQLFFYNLVSGILAMAKTEERNRFLEMQEKQFASQQRYMRASEKARHDFRHSIRALAELYDSGDMRAVGEYLHGYIDAMPVNEITNYCGNTAVNALLNYYSHIAQQNGIDLTLQVRLPDSLPVSDVDLCNMLGNILENAVTACQKAEDKYIQLTVLADNYAQLYIVAANSFDGKVRQKDGRYLSTSRTGSGIGLSSVASTAEAYGGVAQFSHEDSRFFSNIAIPLK